MASRSTSGRSKGDQKDAARQRARDIARRRNLPGAWIHQTEQGGWKAVPFEPKGKDMRSLMERTKEFVPLTGGTPGQGTSAGPGGAVANAVIDAFTEGGEGIALGAETEDVIAGAVAGEFEGINFKVAQFKLPPNVSPDAQNVDGMGVGGSLQSRRGMISMKGKDENGQTPTTLSAYSGRSIIALGQSHFQSTGTTFVVTYDNTANSNLGSGTSVASTIVTLSAPRSMNWNPPRSMEGPAAGASLKITTVSSNVVSGTAALPVSYRTDTSNELFSDAKIWIRASFIAPPKDVYGRDSTNSSLVVAAGGQNFGYSDFDVISGQQRHYSIWAQTTLGFSDRQEITVDVP